MPKRKAQEVPRCLNGDLEIDLMRRPDLAEVMRIESLCFPSPWPYNQFIHEMEKNPQSRCFVLRKTGDSKKEMVGFSICWLVGYQLHVANIAIHPEYQRHGYGEALMRFLIEFGVQRHCRRVVLEVRKSNQKALGLYSKLGFQMIGSIPRYYEDTQEDAYLLSKTIGS